MEEILTIAGTECASLVDSWNCFITGGCENADSLFSIRSYCQQALILS